MQSHLIKHRGFIRLVSSFTRWVSPKKVVISFGGFFEFLGLCSICLVLSLYRFIWDGCLRGVDLFCCKLLKVYFQISYWRIHLRFTSLIYAISIFNYRKFSNLAFCVYSTFLFKLEIFKAYDFFWHLFDHRVRPDNTFLSFQYFSAYETVTQYT